ncbi:hypothetical protein GCM10009609_75110 [Pseudonocardia aurantiaca]
MFSLSRRVRVIDRQAAERLREPDGYARATSLKTRRRRSRAVPSVGMLAFVFLSPGLVLVNGFDLGRLVHASSRDLRDRHRR